MTVSFDLDETLFVDPHSIPIEIEPKWPFSIIYKERIRKGTISLIKSLKNKGINVYVYTTSFRSISYIKNLFKQYNIVFDKIINGQIHKEFVQKNHSEILPSKVPSYFRINVHVDDDITVKENCDILGVKVYILRERNDNWENELESYILTIKSNCA